MNQRGAFVGKTPEQAFFVRTSSTNRKASSDVAITLRVGFAPERPNEFVTYDFRYHESSMTTEIVPVSDAEAHLG
jgi:hypothetical protein